ncbi:MAG: redoxin domain-containing protein [Acidimicrobiales bacterium]|nr:redoxin domain-containing protein [Acidimicrobiales bacterium]
MTRRLLIALVAASALLAACGGGNGESDPATDAAERTEDDPGSSEPGSPNGSTDAAEGDGSSDAGGTGGESPPAIFDFVLDDVRGGDQVDGSSYAGSDVIVWFWAPWCTKCNQEADAIAELSAERDDVRFLGMAGLDGKDASADFVERHGLDGFAHAFDEDGGTWQEFGITTQSSFAFVNDDGSFETVSYTNLGSDELQRRIDELVAS